MGPQWQQRECCKERDSVKETPKSYIKKKWPARKMYKRTEHCSTPYSEVKAYTGMPLPIGRRPSPRTADKDKLEKYLITCSDRGYGKNRM